jgi:DNA-binding GntR family transcriptional regulator
MLQGIGIAGGKSPSMTYLISDSLPDQITRYLTEKIISGDLTPGERIMEAHLAKKLGVSRAPIREALQILRKNRLVELIPRQGARVAPLSGEYVRWLYDIIFELYTIVVRQLIAQADQERIGLLDAILGRIEEISRAGDEQAYYNARFEYAQAALDATDNLLLKEMIMDFVPGLMRIHHIALKQRVGNISKTLVQLRKINAAIKARDEDTGVKAVRKLLTSDMEFALHAIEEKPRRGAKKAGRP